VSCVCIPDLLHSAWRRFQKKSSPSKTKGGTRPHPMICLSHARAPYAHFFFLYIILFFFSLIKTWSPRPVGLLLQSLHYSRQYLSVLSIRLDLSLEEKWVNICQTIFCVHTTCILNGISYLIPSIYNTIYIVMK
jgi:hypothetical protein